VGRCELLEELAGSHDELASQHLLADQPPEFVTQPFPLGVVQRHAEDVAVDAHELLVARQACVVEMKPTDRLRVLGPTMEQRNEGAGLDVDRLQDDAVEVEDDCAELVAHAVGSGWRSCSSCSTSTSPWPRST
jgi:hypothetical protein